MSKEQTSEELLDQLIDAYKEALKEGFKIIEIDLTPVAHEEIKETLTKRMNREIHKVTSILGIPVIIDSTIPKDKLWLMKKKEQI